MPQNNIPPIIISFERDTSELIRVIEKGAKTISDRRIKMAAEKWLQDYLHLLTPLFSKNGKEQKIHPDMDMNRTQAIDGGAQSKAGHGIFRDRGV